MPLRRARFYRFRNLSDHELETDARQVLFIGENGQGKTNLLEAVYVLHLGSSFRTRRDNQICRQGTREWSVWGELGIGDRSIGLQTKYVSGTKRILINEKETSDRKNLLALESVILFGHEDYRIVYGPMEERRRFFDQTLIQVSEDYLLSWKRYHHFLVQRNALLKQGRNGELFDVLEAQMSQEADRLMDLRAGQLSDFEATFQEAFDQVSQTQSGLRLVYQPSIPERGALRAQLERCRDRDLQSGFTSLGPHRDRWNLVWQGQTFADIASTGQIRLASLCLKIAQAKFLRARIQRPLVFLVDDVLLELDPPKRKRLMRIFPEYDQVFYTFLPGSDAVEESRERLTYTIEEGRWLRMTI